jgi:UDP-N-acetylglucosamine:LPS N-acetylglucosamine transferase
LLGQEEQNIDFVIQHEFGDYKSDSDPKAIAKTVGEWLHDPSGKILTEMSIHAKEAGSPNAAAEIVKNIGTSALRWKEICLE